MGSNPTLSATSFIFLYLQVVVSVIVLPPSAESQPVWRYPKSSVGQLSFSESNVVQRRGCYGKHLT